MQDAAQAALRGMALRGMARRGAAPCGMGACETLRDTERGAMRVGTRRGARHEMGAMRDATRHGTTTLRGIA